jgi:uncharacterized membrane protein
MMWLYLALIAPFFYAVSNILDKYVVDSKTSGTADYMFFGSIGSVILSLYFFSTGELDNVIEGSLLPAILSGILMNISYLFFAFALSKEDSHKLIPFFLLIPILLIFIDSIFYSSSIPLLHWLSLALSLVGSYILMNSDGSDSVDFSIFSSAKILMLISVIILTGSVFVTDKMANPAETNSFIMLQCFGFSLTTIFYLFWSPWRSEIFHGIKSVTASKVFAFFINDVADLLGNWFFIFAISLAPTAGYVSLALGIQPFYVLTIVIVISRYFPNSLNERLNPKTVVKTVVGAIFLIFGLAIIAL